LNHFSNILTQLRLRKYDYAYVRKYEDGIVYRSVGTSEKLVPVGVIGHKRTLAPAGARGSGTNDKAGAMMNLLRWVSARTIKEMFVPPRDYTYPFLG